MTCRSLVLVALLGICQRTHAAQSARTLWYAAPGDDSRKSVSFDRASWSGKNFAEALVIGNGRLGSIIYGGVGADYVEFNEDSLWIGDETHTGAYQAFGSFEVALENHDGEPVAYRRELDLEHALHTVRYRMADVSYCREAFASHPANVMVFHYTADKHGAYSASIRLVDAHGGKANAKGNRVTFSGNLGGCVYGPDKKKYKLKQYDYAMDYEAVLQVSHEGGVLRVEGETLVLDKVDSFTIFLTGGTDYAMDRSKCWKGEHPDKRLDADISRVAKTSYEVLKREHIADYRSLYERFDLNLGSSPNRLEALPTDKRNEMFKTDGAADPDFQELLYQYARYLLISSSRSGSLPANLQGLWNNMNNPSWRCDYHMDVNIEMNYWLTDSSNLSECFSPLAEWLFSIRESRMDQTKQAFPDVRGWHLQLSAGLLGGGAAHLTPGCAAWVVQNLWDHYAFTGDKEYLATRAYRLIKDLAQYWEDRLVEEDDGTLVAPISKSPEHGLEHVGNSFEQQLIWDLFTNYIEASEVLGMDEMYRARVKDMKRRLLEPQIGAEGQLQEWREDLDFKHPYNKKEKGLPHRHLSHMLAVYPGRQISPTATPDLAEAAKVSMRRRGKGSTAWSRGHRALVWARLHDSEQAAIHYTDLFERFMPNLLSHIGAGYTFQIDANFGFAAIVNEMLLQSHMGELHLLPCLPAMWPDGSVKGMKARGGFTVDMEWIDSTLAKATITSNAGRPCRLRTANPVRVVADGEAIAVEKLKDGAFRFPTQAGMTYELERE